MSSEVVEARHFICDRCGRGLLTEKTIPLPYGWILVKQFDKFNAVVDGGEYHLCTECSESFSDFMQNN